MEDVEMDSMECICGEVLTAPKEAIIRRPAGSREALPEGRGLLAKKYAEHMARPDHKIRQNQWPDAYQKILEAKQKSTAE